MVIDAKVNLRQGIIYLAFGANYHAEAKRSIASLRLVSPNLPITVITDSPWAGESQPDTFLVRAYTDGFASKPLYIGDSPYERTLYLDTDTYIARDLTPVFGLLNFYDIGVRFGGAQLYEPDGLEYHLQCNSGVILFNNSERTKEVFERWRDEYERGRLGAESRNELLERRGLGDQRYLAIAIAKSQARPVHLAENLNFALFETLISYSPLAVLHGRLPAMAQIAREINAEWDESVDWRVRIWLPNIRGLLPSGLRHSDPILAIALVLRRLTNDFKRSMRALFRQ